MTELAHLEHQTAQPDSWTPLNLNTLPDQPPIQPQLGDTGLLYPGMRHVFSGPPESAKTLAAYCALILVARTGQTGILIDFEMGSRDAKKRLQELGATPTEIDHIPYLEPDQPATTQRLQNLIQLQPALVVIDAAAGAYQAEGLDDNKRQDVERFSRLYVGAFWIKGIATIIIDHVTKNTEARGKFAIGSERKLGSSDVHLGFDTITPISRGTTGHYKITTHKDRGGCLKRGHIADLHLDSDPDTNQITWKCIEPQSTTSQQGGYFRPTHLMEKVSIDVELRTQPATRNTIATSLGGTKDYVLKAITALVTEGFLTETDGPGRAKHITHARRYRQNNPVDNPVDNTTNHNTGSVVRTWFHSGSRTTRESGGSVVRPPYGDDTLVPPTPDHPEPTGWFDTNGHLTDDYYDTLELNLNENEE